MKKAVKLFSVLCMGIALFSFAACGWTPPIDGQFPYDTAVQQGYEGTESEWLASQEQPSTVYRKLFDEAKEEGYTGSYVDFLKTLGITGEAEPYLQSAVNCVVSLEAVFDSSGNGSAGSGVILSLDETSGDMLIITNYHVLYSASARNHFATSIRVWLYGTRTAKNYMSAHYAGGALNYDIALLTVKGSETVTEETSTGASQTHTNLSVVQANSPCEAKIFDSDSVSVGETVYAVGNPLNGGSAVSHGVLSQQAEDLEMKGADEKTDIKLLVMRTDAPLNHGNSGGALFNCAGELIGIVNARSEASGVVGVGYAIPINRAIAVAKNLLDNDGKVSLARLTATFSLHDSRTIYDETTGKTYTEDKIVAKEVGMGAASVAGLEVGDTLVSAKLSDANGVKRQEFITAMHIIEDVLLDVRAGDVLELTVSREGQPVVLRIQYSKQFFESIA